ncbi:hypothetical protein C5167_006953, partial [Papaver somniferum]
ERKYLKSRSALDNYTPPPKKAPPKSGDYINYDGGKLWRPGDTRWFWSINKRHHPKYAKYRGKKIEYFDEIAMTVGSDTTNG